jgi:hypothetical protein
MPSDAPDVQFAFEDLSSEDLRQDGGLLVADQSPPKRKRRGVDMLFRRQAADGNPQGVGEGTGPTPVTEGDAGMIVPAELRGDDPRKQKTRDALLTLFGTDIATLPPNIEKFALEELAKAEQGDRLDPVLLQELIRVCKTCSIIVKTPNLHGEGQIDSPLQIHKTDDELQIVWGEVYIPDLPDSQGDFMTADEIRKAAYRFAADGYFDQIDRNHDKEPCGAVVVESFIARAGDPDFIEGAWVIGVHVPDPEIWAAVKRGDFNGFSMEGIAGTKTVKEMVIDLPEEIRGTTQIAEDHSHPFVIKFDSEGVFMGGRAELGGAVGAYAHEHDVRKGSVTEPGGANSHIHRYSLPDALLELQVNTGLAEAA